MHKIRCLNTLLLGLLLLGLFLVPKPAEAQFNLNPAACALVKLLRDNDVDEIVGYQAGMRQSLAKQLRVRPVDLNRSINGLIGYGILVPHSQGTPIARDVAQRMVTNNQRLDLSFNDRPDLCPPPPSGGAPATVSVTVPEIAVAQGQLHFTGEEPAEIPWGFIGGIVFVLLVLGIGYLLLRRPNGSARLAT